MQEDRQNSNYNEDELDLRELIEALLKEKYIIIGITAAALILAAIYTLGMLQPSYESSSTIMVNLQEEVNTPYGSYKLPMSTMDEYQLVLSHPYAVQKTIKNYGGELTRQGVLNRMNVTSIQDTGAFHLHFSGGSPEEAYRLNRIHLDSYLTQVEMMLRRMAVEHFYNEYNTQSVNLRKDLLSLEEDRVKLQALIADTPMVLNLENALISEAEYALIASSIQGLDLSELEGDKIINQELNPSFLQLHEQLTEKALEASSLEVKIQTLEADLVELEEELNALRTYQETLNTDHFQGSVSDSMRNIVTVVNPPEMEEEKVGPRNSLNLAIGTVLGLMLGVFTAFFKHYWESTGKEKKQQKKV